MKGLLTTWIWSRTALGFTSSRRHVMDELVFGGGGLDRGSRSALQVLVPCLADGLDVEGLSAPIDVPPAERRDVPPPKLLSPETDPKIKPRSVR